MWLDLKNPDYCFPYDKVLEPCSIIGLRDLAREILEPLDVRVLYGFYEKTVNSTAWQIILNNMTSNEALNVNGKTPDVIKTFEHAGPPPSSAILACYVLRLLPTSVGIRQL